MLPQGLKDTFANKIPVWKKEQKEIITKYGDKILGTCTVDQAFGGMRSVKSMVYETSLLDPVEVGPSAGTVESKSSENSPLPPLSAKVFRLTRWDVCSRDLALVQHVFMQACC